MRAVITLKDSAGNVQTLRTVLVYAYDAGASDYCGTLIGQATEITGDGQYYINMAERQLVTVKVNGVRREGLTGVELPGDYMDAAKLKDGTITQAKCSTSLLDLIGSGGSITNNPDGVYLDADGDVITLHEDYQHILDGNAAASNGIDIAGIYDHVKHNAIVNVRDFGALGDGANDDSAEIQDAIDAISLNNSILYFPTGTYIITSKLEFDTLSNFTIEGNNSTIKVANSTSNVDMDILTFFDCDNFEVRNLVLDGNRANRTPAEGRGRFNCSLYHCTNFRLKNIYSKNALCDGFIIGAYDAGDADPYVPHDTGDISMGGLMENCRTYYCYRNGLSIIHCHNLMVRKCRFEYSTGTAPEAGLDIESDDSSLSPGIKNINIEDCEFITNDGYGVDGAMNDNPEVVIIKHCLFEDNDAGAIQMAARDMVIDGNTFQDHAAATYAIIYVNGDVTNAKNIKIINNTFKDITASGKPCIQLTNPSDSSVRMVIVEKNYFETITHRGIENYCSHVQIRGNIFKDVTDNPIYQVADYCIIDENVVHSCDRGIKIRGANNMIRGNKLIDTLYSSDKTEGVIATDTGSNEIIDNTIKLITPDTNVYGIEIVNDYKTLRGNVVEGCSTTNHIHISGSETGIRRDNYVSSSQFDTKYRMAAGDPTGSVTPKYIGEEYLDTNTSKWYKSYGTGSGHWVALN